jgi:hypothetical protein
MHWKPSLYYNSDTIFFPTLTLHFIHWTSSYNYDWNFTVGLDRLYKIRKKYRCVPNEIKQNSYCTSANIKIFFLVQYSNDIWKNHILTVLITLLKKKYLLLCNKRVIVWILVNIVPRSVSYCTCTFAQYDILLGTIFTNIHAIILYYKK